MDEEEIRQLSYLTDNLFANRVFTGVFILCFDVAIKFNKYILDTNLLMTRRHSKHQLSRIISVTFFYDNYPFRLSNSLLRT